MKTAIGFLLAALFATAAMAAPTVGSLAANPASIKAGVSTSVTLTVPISGGTVLASGANLLNQTAAGATIGILGVMHDDGKAGDAVANDGIYTLVVPFNPAQPGTIYLQASTAFKGVLSRVKSPILPLSVASLSGPPTITDFRPKSGPIGTLVSVTLGNFTLVPNTTPQVIVSAQNGNTISVSASTFSAATLSFVVPAGAASGKFSISFGTQTAASSNPFAISTSSSFTLSVGPSVASLIQGQSTTYAVKLNSTNGFNGLAALSLAGAPSGIQAAFKPPQITASQTDAQYIPGPVYWLATGDVNIAGTVDLSGTIGYAPTSNRVERVYSVPGAGGFAGGPGGSLVVGAEAGAGPGGGKAASCTNNGGASGFGGVFSGSQYLIPLIGGSGGGGGCLNLSSTFAAGGGAGGGALMIASSTTILISGAISARGGQGNGGGGSVSGDGSGGAIRLVANSINLTASGSVDVSPYNALGVAQAFASSGFARIEAYQPLIGGTITGSHTMSTPFQLALPATGPPIVQVSTVNGMPVNSTHFTFPDVSINTTQPVPVVITGQNVPVGAIPTLYIVSESGPDQIVVAPPLSGNFQSSKSTVNIPYPPGGSRGIIRATWTN